MYGGGSRSRGVGWQLGLTWQRKATGGTSNVLSIIRGAQTRGYSPPGKVGMSVLPERVVGLEDSPGTHPTA